MRCKCWPLHFSSQPLRVEKKNIYVGQGNKRIPGVASEDTIWEKQCCFHNSGPYMAWGQWRSNGWRRYSVKQMWRKHLQGHIDLIVNKELRMIRHSHNVDSKCSEDEPREGIGSGQEAGECGILRMKVITQTTIIRTRYRLDVQNIRWVPGVYPVTTWLLLHFSRERLPDREQR